MCDVGYDFDDAFDDEDAGHKYYVDGNERGRRNCRDSHEKADGVLYVVNMKSAVRLMFVFISLSPDPARYGTQRALTSNPVLISDSLPPQLERTQNYTVRTSFPSLVDKWMKERNGGCEPSLTI